MATIEEVIIEVRANTANASKGLADVNKQVESLKKHNEELAASNAKLTAAHNEMAASLAKLKQHQEQTRQNTASLAQTTRDFATSMLGANVAAFTLGTVLGSIIMQSVMGAVRAIAEAVTQVQALQNQLAATAGVGGEFGAVFTRLEGIAEGNTRSLGELTQSFAALRAQAIGTRVTLEESLRILEEHETRLKSVRGQTLAGAASGFMRELGSVISGVDNALGVSQALISILGFVERGLRSIASMLPQIPRTVAEWRARQEDLNRQLSTAVREHREVATRMQEANNTAERQLQLRREIAEAQRRINDLQNMGQTAEQRQRTLDIDRETIANLQHQISIGHLLNRDFMFIPAVAILA